MQMLKRALIAYVNSAKAVWSEIAYPLTIASKRLCKLKSYRIYGNSVQDGTPTPEAPIEVQSVGELVTEGENEGKYKIPVTVTNSETEIEPQTFNIYLDEPLRKIGDAQDVIDFEKGVVLRNVKKKVFDGSENWQIDSSTNGNNFVYYEYVEAYPNFKNSNKDAFSNRVKQISWSNLWYNYYKEPGSTNLTVGFACTYNKNDGAGNIVLYLKVTPYSTLPTVAEWKTQLASWHEEGNPCIAWYVAAIEEEQVSLPKLPQFKGTTIYETDTSINPSGIEVCYYE